MWIVFSVFKIFVSLHVTIFSKLLFSCILCEILRATVVVAWAVKKCPHLFDYWTNLFIVRRFLRSLSYSLNVSCSLDKFPFCQVIIIIKAYEKKKIFLNKIFIIRTILKKKFYMNVILNKIYKHVIQGDPKYFFS